MKSHEMKAMILKALQTDGNHHKQWYLEQMLKEFVLDFDKFKEKYQWEDGIAP